VQAEALLAAIREQVDVRLDQLLPSEKDRPHELHQAMRYGCLTSGKRIRPALCLASSTAVGGNGEVVLDAACAIEMVHAFSLIHDDLPAIDNDRVRRGEPSCHVKFGEAMALLAGDALFALAFRCISSSSSRPARSCQATMILAEAAGSAGLVGGEVLDVLAEGKKFSSETVEAIHSKKTAALVAAACEIGGRLEGCLDKEADALRGFGRRVGLAFQIVDDVLNETAPQKKTGKSKGSDKKRKKATYPGLLGVERSLALARLEVEKALGMLSEVGIFSRQLETLAIYAIERDR
jgi:geranylgeranyl diphosphate synthase type II